MEQTSREAGPSSCLMMDMAMSKVFRIKVAAVLAFCSTFAMIVEAGSSFSGVLSPVLLLSSADSWVIERFCNS